MKHLKTFEHLYDQFDNVTLDERMQSYYDVFVILGYEMKIIAGNRNKSIFQQFVAKKGAHKFEMWDDTDHEGHWYVISHEQATDATEIGPISDLVKYISRYTFIEESVIWDTLVKNDLQYLIQAPDNITKKYSKQIGQLKDIGIFE